MRDPVPGESAEGITVPRGDPDALRASGRQLSGVAAQLDSSSSSLLALPGTMSGWAGPGSSAFASLTGQHAAAVSGAHLSALTAALGLSGAAEVLADAQRDAARALARAKTARKAINVARRDIAEAEDAQRDARARMAAAAAARKVAEARMATMVIDAITGDGSAAAAADMAASAERDAERDLHEAERHERQARTRLEEAEDDLRQARRDGQDAAESAELSAVGLQASLSTLPGSVMAAPGGPSRANIAAAAGIARARPMEDVPVSEREPPSNWPGWAKAYFKLGRGTRTAFDGAADLVSTGVSHPTRIPGALADVGEHAVHNPVGTGKALIGYDELAAGRYEDWLGQLGFGALTAGAGTGLSRAARLRRLYGAPRLEPLAGKAPRNGEKFAGRRFDPTRPDFGARPGTTPPKLAASDNAGLVERYPKGVRFTRAGYPIFTPYAVERVRVEGLTGDLRFDTKPANAAADLTHTPKGYTWHHVEDGRTMELVPRELHEAARHDGGALAIRSDQVGHLTPGGSFTAGERGVGAAGASGGFLGGPAAAQTGGP